MFYPPFTSLARVMVLDRNREKARDFAQEVSDFLDGLRTRSIRILGPAAAPLEKLKRTYRHQLLIKSASRADLHSALERLRTFLEEKKTPPTKVIIDVDPVSLM